MKNISILLTCFNRKEKTLKALDALYKAYKNTNQSIHFDVILTDDGSTDGTAQAVKEKFPETIILTGNGSLFWAKGMNNSWNHALQLKEYDGHLLLNDDTNVFDNLFEQLQKTHQYCLNTYNTGGVYIGSTINPETNKISYGGSNLTNRFLYKFKKVIPNGQVQTCELGNANIMFAHSSVVKKVGVLSKGYAHGVADYDYTLKCIKKKIPVLITPEFCGTCEYDHKNMYHNFKEKTFKERMAYFHHPLGIDFKSRLQYMRKFFPLRYPIFFIVGYLKVFFPKFYVNRMTKR